MIGSYKAFPNCTAKWELMPSEKDWEVNLAVLESNTSGIVMVTPLNKKIGYGVELNDKKLKAVDLFGKVGCVTFHVEVDGNMTALVIRFSTKNKKQEFLQEIRPWLVN